MLTWLIVVLVVLFVVISVIIISAALQKDPPKIVNTTNIYRTKDGKAYFIFRYVLMEYNGYYEIDILSQPNYKGRDSDISVTHRLTSDRPDCARKICIYASKAPKTLELAMRLSADWAELTQTYIKTGKTLDEQIRRRS